MQTLVDPVTLEPGYVFAIDPQMTIEGGELSVRREDMILNRRRQRSYARVLS